MLLFKYYFVSIHSLSDTYRISTQKENRHIRRSSSESLIATASAFFPFSSAKLRIYNEIGKTLHKLLLTFYIKKKDKIQKKAPMNDS